MIGTRIFRRRVRPGVIWAAVLMALAALLLTSSDAAAGALRQDATVGDPLIAPRQFVGAAKRDGAVVRSGPSTGHLSVLTLTLDQEVIVVGADTNREFLRILPPEGSFCMVPKARVNLRGDTTAGGQKIGRVTETCSVKAGSRINSMPGETTARLTAGEEVTVIGEDSTYYHVIPPRSVFYYVHSTDLRRVREVKVTEIASGWKVGELPAEAPDGSGTPANPTPAEGDPDQDSGDGPLPSQDDPAMGENALERGDPLAETGVPEVVIPTTQPALLGEFKELDARYIESAKLPLVDQPLEQLKQEYSAMLGRAEADAAMSGVVPALKARIETIELRQQALQDLLAVQAMREQMTKRQQSLEAENQELAERAQGAKVTVYAAVGQLRPSTLQVGGGSLFRLCDPATGRTLIYLRAEGEPASQLARQLERFVGIKGETTHDKDLDLKFIKVVEVAAVDQAQVFKSVAAAIIPPSLAQNAGAGD